MTLQHFLFVHDRGYSGYGLLGTDANDLEEIKLLSKTVGFLVNVTSYQIIALFGGLDGTAFEKHERFCVI